MVQSYFSLRILIFQFIWVTCIQGGFSQNVNPGLQLRISQAGLDYAAKQAVAALGQKAQGQTIPDQHGRADVKIGKVDYDITSMRVTGFSPGTGAVRVGQGALTLSVTNVGASVHGDWRYKYKKAFIKISDHGSFDVSVSGASISLAVALGLDSAESGRPTIHSASCSSNVDKVDVKFHGGASWLYNLFSSNVERALKGNLKDMMCKAAQDAINDNAAKELATLKVVVPIEKIVDLDYRLVAAPHIGNGVLETYHKGEVFWHGDRTEAPYTPTPMADPGTQTKMLSIWLSDYVMNTMGYVLNNRGILRFNLSAKDLPPEDRGLLNTTCSSFKCFGNILPKVVQQKYPDLSIAIDMAASSSPLLNITTVGLHGNMAGYMNYSVLLNNGSKVFLFSTMTKVDVTLVAQMNKNKITANVTNIDPDLKLVESTIGDVEGTLKFLFDVAANSFIKPKLNEVGQKGLDLPSIDDITYVNPSLVFLKNSLCLMTDVQYTPDTTLYFRSSKK